MVIPPFNSQGNIPEGIHPTTLAEFKDRFVLSFSESTTREPLFSGYLTFCNTICAYEAFGVQWGGGSYTTEKNDPHDIDLVLHFDAVEMNKDGKAAQFRREVGGMRDIYSNYGCHVFIVPEYPPDDPRYQSGLDKSNHWKKFFSKDRNDNPRGLVELNLDSPVFRYQLLSEVNEG